MINLAFFQKTAHWLWVHKIPILPKIIQLFIFVFYSSSINPRTAIGKGTFFSHAGFGVLINENVTIGENCKIGNNVSIIGQGPFANAPIIKNRVFIGPGAIIQGPVVLEDNVIVAPNAVVNKSVPENAIVAGIPAKIIGWSNRLSYDIFKDETFDLSWREYLTENKSQS